MPLQVSYKPLMHRALINDERPSVNLFKYGTESFCTGKTVGVHNLMKTDFSKLPACFSEMP